MPKKKTAASVPALAPAPAPAPAQVPVTCREQPDMSSIQKSIDELRQAQDRSEQLVQTTLRLASFKDRCIDDLRQAQNRSEQLLQTFIRQELQDLKDSLVLANFQDRCIDELRQAQDRSEQCLRNFMRQELQDLKDCFALAKSQDWCSAFKDTISQKSKDPVSPKLKDPVSPKWKDPASEAILAKWLANRKCDADVEKTAASPTASIENSYFVGDGNDDCDCDDEDHLTEVSQDFQVSVTECNNHEEVEHRIAAEGKIFWNRLFQHWGHLHWLEPEMLTNRLAKATQHSVFVLCQNMLILPNTNLIGYDLDAAAWARFYLRSGYTSSFLGTQPLLEASPCEHRLRVLTKADTSEATALCQPTRRAVLLEADATADQQGDSCPMLFGTGEHSDSGSFSSNYSCAGTGGTHAEYSSSVCNAIFSAASGRELSLGVELECVIPDINQVPRVTELESLAGKEDVLQKVAEELTERIRWLGKGSESRDTRVSTKKSDWGHLWTLTEDTTICLKGFDQFAVEAVSKIMRLDDVDRQLFCDIASALSLPPFSAIYNDSTGIHVHIGCYPSFFTATEVTFIIKAYSRLEPAINRLLLPASRQTNRFCRDLAELLSHAEASSITTGQKAVARPQGEVAEATLEAHVDSLLLASKDLMKRMSAESPSEVRGVISKKCLFMAMHPGPLFCRIPMHWSTKATTQLLTPLKAESFHIPRAMVLKSVSVDDTLLWQHPTAADLCPGAGVRRKYVDLPQALDSLPEEALVECIFSIPKDVSAESMELWLFRERLLGKGDDARYYKLNLTRIALPSAQATLEFRQFPSGYFDDPLFIWGWVRFLARLVDRACVVAARVPGAWLPANDSQEELERFLELRSDPTLMAWFRDACKRMPSSQTS